MKAQYLIPIALLLTACGSGSTPIQDDQPQAPESPFAVVENPPVVEPVIVEPVVTPEPVEPVVVEPVIQPDSVIHDGKVFFEIDRVEVFDGSPTAAFVRVANFTDGEVTSLSCRLTAYQNENPVMLIQSQGLYTPDGDELALSSGQDSETRMSFTAEGYTGHHVDKIEWMCMFRLESKLVSGSGVNRGTWEGVSVYGQL